MQQTNKKKNLLGLDLSAMQEYMLSINHKPFRAKQLVQWIHQHGICDFKKMHTLPKTLMEKLEQVAEIRHPEVINTVTSSDDVIKWSLKVGCNSLVEMVLIKHTNRNTLCISSQAGCVADCSFCVTGKQGFSGDLTASEIIGQLHLAKFVLAKNENITNVVFMGMGEPLFNTSNVLLATSLMTSDFAYGLSKRKVTISTVGIVPEIYELCGKTEVALAVSLHAPNDKLRSKIMPINNKHPLKDLMKACKAYLASISSKRFITFEYLLIDGINDSPSIARELVKYISKLPCKVNLIPYNENDYCSYKTSKQSSIEEFSNILTKAGFITTVRKSRGAEESAACGQLAGEIEAINKRKVRNKISNIAKNID
jgi:23S rRNA (adenine2503-C2)-methyltransferase